MKADLHIHTTFSDGLSSPEEIVDIAIERGIDIICITDHRETEGAIRAMRYAFDKEILVVPGIEILSKAGDVLGINVKKVIPDGLSVKETFSEIRKQGGIAVIPHPFDRPFTGFWGGEKLIKDVSPDAIEVFNAGVFFKNSNKKALKFARENNFCFTAGSDAHIKDYVGRGLLYSSENISSEKDLIKIIMEKRATVLGNPLGFFETFKNVLHSNVKDIAKYYYSKKKNGKILKKEFLSKQNLFGRIDVDGVEVNRYKL